MLDRARVLIHLFACAQVGVLTRLTVGELFGGACGSEAQWVPCVTSPYGALFIDLPINIVGSFLMGLFVSSDVLSNTIRHNLAVHAPMAILPRKSSLQAHTPLHIGLRTGLCGSLTTLASWMLQTVLMMVGGAAMPDGNSQWVAALVGLYIGTTAATASLTLGQHIALYIYHHLNPGDVIPYGGPAPEDDQAEADEVEEAIIAEAAARQSSLGITERSRAISRDYTTNGKHEFVVISPEDARNSSSSKSRDVRLATTQQQYEQQDIEPANGAHGLRPVGSVLHQGHSEVLAAAATGSAPALSSEGQGSWTVPGQQLVPATVAGPFAGSWPRPAAQQVAASSLLITSAATDAVFEVEVAPEALKPMHDRSWMLVDGLALAMLLVMTGVSLWRGIVTKYYLRPVNAFTPHNLWLSVLLAPVGCYCRFYLARFNGKLPGRWSWFPAGESNRGRSGVLGGGELGGFAAGESIRGRSGGLGGEIGGVSSR